MISLAQDLARKNQGYIPNLLILDKPLVETMKDIRVMNPSKDIIYVTEDGEQSSRADIARKYDVLAMKVKYLFEKYSPEEAYRLINTDLRSTNGQREIYALPCGKWVPAQEVANYYKTSRSSIHRAWTKHDKCPIKANAYLMDKFNSQAH